MDNWQDKYLCPLVEKEKFSLKKVKKLVEDFRILFIHSISFHDAPKEPIEELPDFTSKDTDMVYSVCREFYNDANERIDKLEDKAIKLLSYVSALFAFISFAFINTSIILTKIILAISMVLLVLSMLISFRCVNVKGRKSLFIPDVFNFESDIPKDNFDKKVISKKLLNTAIYNQNIGDNTADILKAARYVLALALIVSTIGFITGIGGYFKTSDATTTVKIENQVELKDIQSRLDIMNKTLEQISNNINNLDNENLQEEIDRLSNELELYKTNYESLLKRLENIENSINIERNSN
jgi:hypothetical protein